MRSGAAVTMMRVERRVLRPAPVAVAFADRDVAVAERLQALAAARRASSGTISIE